MNEDQILISLGRIEQKVDDINLHVRSHSRRIKKLESNWGKVMLVFTALSFPVTYLWKRVTKQQA